MHKTSLKLLLSNKISKIGTICLEIFNIFHFGRDCGKLRRMFLLEEITMSASTADRVKEIIAQQLDVDPSKVVDGARFIDDLGADSLDTVELVMALEEEFGVEISPEQTEDIQSVQEAISFIEKHKKA